MGNAAPGPIPATNVRLERGWLGLGRGNGAAAGGRFGEDAGSALGMPSHARFVLDLPLHQRELLGRGLRRVLTSGRADTVPQLLGA
jgi:hypothetical protein